MISFEEFLKAREEYEAFTKGQAQPEKPAQPAEEPKQEEPKQEEPAAEETPADELPSNGPAEDYRKELNEIRSQLAIMARALSPSLGDIEPVGIDDVVSKLLNE